MYGHFVLCDLTSEFLVLVYLFFCFTCIHESSIAFVILLVSVLLCHWAVNTLVLLIKSNNE